MDPLFLSLPDSPDFRGWISANGFPRSDSRDRISANGFPRMDPAMFAAKTVNFELFFDIPFFRIGVDFASYGSLQVISLHFSAG